MSDFPNVLECISDLTKVQIDELLQIAQNFKRHEYNPNFDSFSRPVMASFFMEPSTRTKNSFDLAMKRLGGHTIDFSPAQSSLVKGESLRDTLLTFYHQGMDLCVLRSSESCFIRQFRETTPIKLINAGDGSHQHPTQALLDLFTFSELDLIKPGATIAFIGDCHHSRVVHSLAELLPQFGINIIFCAPAAFHPRECPAGIQVTESLDEAFNKADFLYLLRIQKERHDTTNEFNEYHQEFGLDLKKYQQYKKSIPIFHPGPANIGVEISEDLISSKHYQGYQQVKHSIYMRMAILAKMLGIKV